MAPTEILRPVSFAVIATSLVLAFMFALIPWPRAVLWLVPDLVALFLLFWAINAPSKVGFLLCWVLGLLVDIAYGGVLGEHAIAYIVLAYLADRLRRRMALVQGWPQIGHVFPILSLVFFTTLLVRYVALRDTLPWWHFSKVIIASLLWPLCNLLHRWPGWSRNELT